MHCIKQNFDKILLVLKDVLGDDFPKNGNLLRPGPKPKFSDIEVIALSLTAECMGIDSECYLFYKLRTNYKMNFKDIISRRQYNDRRKSLFMWQEKIRSEIASLLNDINEVFSVDSMPLEICKISRAERNKMGKDVEHESPDKGYCASQSKWFYGYKLHCACSPSGVISALNLTRASVHDVHFLKDISSTLANCIVVGDKGYLNKPLKEKLYRENNICLETPMRSNQLDHKKMMYVLRRIRKRIETVFSQLCDQFMIQRNYAKSFAGFKTRILAKVTGMTVLQYINKFIRNTPVGQIKYSLG